MARRQMYDTGPSLISEDEQIHRREFYQYVTRPDIDAPRWNVKIYDKEALAPGYWFTASYEYVDQKDDDHRKYIAPHIYDQQGELIWSGAPLFKGYNLKDFDVQNVKGEKMLTGVYAHSGVDVMVNSNYEIQEQVHVKKYNINLHDFNVVDNGTRAIAMTLLRYSASKEESLAVGFEGRCGVLTTGFIEYDTTTWKRTFEWSAQNHITVNESYLEPNCKHRWDFIHANSIDKFPDGDFLLSGRHTDTLYKVSGRDGHIIWRLGGKTSDFKIDGHFSGQHHSRVRSQNSTHIVLTFLDNAIRPGEPHTTNPQSRGIIMALRTDTTPMTAEVLKTYNHPRADYSPGRGAFSILPNGNAFGAWWMQSLISEHSPDDKLLMEANWIPQLKSYRSFKYEWVGHPKQPPDVHAEAVAASPTELTTVVYVSWNGATEVTHWRLYKTSPDGKQRLSVLTSPRQGFETMLAYEGFATYVMVEGLDRHGNSLGHSAAVRTIQPSNPMHPAVVEAQRQEKQLTESWTSTATATITHPAGIYFAGFVTCATIFLIVWVVMRIKAKKNGPSWIRWQRRPPQYKSKQMYDAVSGSVESLNEGHESDRDLDEDEKAG